MIEMIAAQTLNGALGLNGKLLHKDKTDLQNFKRITLGKRCVVGRTTAESLPNLRGRSLYVVTSKKHVTHKQSRGVVTVPNLDLLPLKYIVIGGGQLYEQLIDRVELLYLTTFNFESEGDVFFPQDKLKDFLPLRKKVFRDKIIVTYKRRHNLKSLRS
jgi:dihydrofolate reductase